MSRNVLPAFILALAPSVTTAQELREITGSVYLRESIALPSRSELVVEATGFQGTSLGVTTEVALGQQGPWNFDLEIPAGVGGELRATIKLANRIQWVSEPIVIAAGSEDVPLGQVLLSEFEPSELQTTFLCGDSRLRVSFRDGNAKVETDGRIFELKAAISADGAKYADETGETIFWSKNGGGLATIEGKELPECAEISAPDENRWSAQGNEPGWRAVIEQARLSLELNYGEDRLDLSLPPPGIVDSAYHYNIAQFGIGFVIQDKMCRDDMSGRLFPQTVEMKSVTGTFAGCGGDSLDLLVGNWVVDEIKGQPTASASAPNISIDNRGQISGSTGCNRFTGSISINGEGGLEIGPPMTTRMACDTAVMKVEREFLEALISVQRFDLNEEGGLLLISGDQTVLKASR
ncbi:META domain-containing protein [Ciceribacter ferrooxidans]|uniref:META domain-containing protein n=1 Tax=Ciceribacter ferrooxidans TaxID=2509717 RepID=A0A4Q2TWA7_9HYPH|nr:META domain-containing protein [Ciceribacter ferrooxidans]RYC23241.1 META domain-containing protein [Ciceribacter ferrooxidans]